jgi:hypothetical protein
VPPNAGTVGSTVGQDGAMLGRRRESKAEPPFDPTTLPAALLAEAKTKPGGWVYEIDPKYDPHGAVPPEGIKGAWKVGDHGVPTGEYTANSNYRPAS